MIGKLHDATGVFTQKGRCAIWKIILAIWLFGAVAGDLRTYKIPNRYCLCMAVSGVMLQGYLYGSAGIREAWMGAIIPFFILFGFFLIRVIGAGDVKLLCAAGVYAGADIWKILKYACLAAGVVAVIKRVLDVQKRSRNPIVVHINKKRYTCMHMSVPIAVGYVWYVMEGWLYGV